MTNKTMQTMAKVTAQISGFALMLALTFNGAALAAATADNAKAGENSKKTKTEAAKPKETEPKAPETEGAKPETAGSKVPVLSGVSAAAFQSVPGAPGPVNRDPDDGEWFLELRYRVNDTDLKGNADRSFLHDGVNHHAEVTFLRKMPVWGFRQFEAMGLFRYTDDPRIDPEVNSLQRGYVRITGPTFELNFGDYLTNYSRFSFNQNTKGLNFWKQMEGLKFAGTAGVFTDRWGSIFRGFEKFSDPRRPADPQFPNKPYTRLVLAYRVEQRIQENSFVGFNVVHGEDVKRTLPREAQLRPIANDVITVDSSIRLGRDFSFAGELALSSTEFDSRIQPTPARNYAGRFEVSHRVNRVSWRVDYARFMPNFFAVNARQVQDLQDFSARGSVDLSANTVLNFSFRQTNDNLPGTPVVVTPAGFVDPVVLTNIGRTQQGTAGDLLRFNQIVDENGNKLTTSVRTPEARLTVRGLPPSKTMQLNFGYRERRFRTNNRDSFSATTGDPLFRDRITRIPFIDLEWAFQSTILGLSYEYRQNRDQVTSSNNTLTNRFVGSYRGSYFLGNWIVNPMFRFETEPETKSIICTDQDRQNIPRNSSVCFLTNAFDIPGRDQTRSYQASLLLEFPKYLELEILYRELNSELLTSFTQEVTDLTGVDVSARFFGNGGYDRPYGRAALTYKFNNSEDRTLTASFERAVNTFLNPDVTKADERSFRENVFQVEFVVRWRR